MAKGTFIRTGNQPNNDWHFLTLAKSTTYCILEESVVNEKRIDNSLCICDCGVGDYRRVLEQQRRLCERRRRHEVPNTVLMVEHPAVITLGARQSANKLLAGRDALARSGIDVVDVRRGGGVTAHNPGQLVVYPILHLRDLGLGISEYVRELETLGIELLEQLRVGSERRKAFPGLWAGGNKIASIGVRVSKGVTYHGMAINIQNDLSIFTFIVPCGLSGVKMTSVLEETGKYHSMSHVKQKLTDLLVRHFANKELVQYDKCA